MPGKRKHILKSSFKPVERVTGCKEPPEEGDPLQVGQSDSSHRSGEEKAAWNRLHIKYCVAQFDARPGRGSRGKSCQLGEIWELNHFAGKGQKKKNLASSLYVLHHHVENKK